MVSVSEQLGHPVPKSGHSNWLEASHNAPYDGRKYRKEKLTSGTALYLCDVDSLALSRHSARPDTGKWRDRDITEHKEKYKCHGFYFYRLYCIMSCKP